MKTSVRLKCAAAVFLALLFFAASARAQYPDPARLFVWSPEEQLLGYKSVEKILPVDAVEASGKPLPLEKAEGPEAEKIMAALAGPTDRFMAKGNVVGSLVLWKGRVLSERYQLDFSPQDRWTSFSVAKSVTGALVGAALEDGLIKSMDDQVIRYVPELAGTAYDGVTILHLLTMTSGVEWNEDYSDPNSDTAKIAMNAAGGEAFIAALARLKREAEPGRMFSYKTGESNLLGLVVSRAAGKSLAGYLSEKIWRPFGMESQAYWATDSQGNDLGGCCLSMTLRDYGRFGLFILGGGRAGGKSVLPGGWLETATSDVSGHGYGYQWHVYGDGSYGASGIFGQMIYIDPKREMVVAALSAWPRPLSREFDQARFQYALEVRSVLDGGWKSKYKK